MGPRGAARPAQPPRFRRGLEVLRRLARGLHAMSGGAATRLPGRELNPHIWAAAGTGSPTERPGDETLGGSQCAGVGGQGSRLVHKVYRCLQ